MLIGALVALPLAALLFAMTEMNVGARGSLSSMALLISLLAVRFNWARLTSVAVLAFLTVLWVPVIIVHLDDGVSQAASYTLIGAVVFVVGAVLAFLAPSNLYYQQAADWRRSRKQRST
ncbi:hypothetical protein BLA60_41425 [Actinophytocola xinjiangensis]|uniref:Uncharacterized protein n=1 Tax=Actinophytocola xinjiangensis TaxID=485602 RepID=A0A7Z1ASW9_9PSEU|nr:hypothetical protein BLA60_41425 [Actinophytocola xinjiangensis]